MSTNIIKINRGDSFEFSIMIPDKTNPRKNYLLTANDIVYFALLYPNQRFEEAFSLKGYTLEDQNPANGAITIKVNPNDTRKLSPGVYYYTIKLQRGGTLAVIDDFDEPDEVRTIIERTKFIVNE
jgi:hypothetical protein